MLMVVAFGLLTGCVLLTLFPTLPQPVPFSCALLCLLVTALLLRFIHYQVVKSIAVFLLCSCIGIGWAYICASQKLQWRFPSEDTGRVISICAKVKGITQTHNKALRFDAQLISYQHQRLSSVANIRLYWPNPRFTIEDGDTFCGNVVLKPRWHFANPGTRDEEKALFLEGICATGKLVTIEHVTRSQSFSLNRLRQHLNDNLAFLLKDKPYLGVIQATTIGVYHEISTHQWQIFERTGTMHAIAISGLHISVVALLCGGWVTLLARRFTRLTAWMPAKCYGGIFALIGALVYSAIAGFSIPTQRALVMIVISIIAIFKRQQLFNGHSLALACIGILLVDPLAPLSVGFWLSFLCVSALIYGGTHIIQKWHRWIMPQWIVFVGLIPFSVYFFQSVSWISPIANMLVLPVIDLFIVPCCLVGLMLSCLNFTLAKWVLNIAHTALEVVGWVLEQLSNLPIEGEVGYVPLGYLFLALLAALFLLAPRGIPGKNWAIFGFLPLFLYQGERPKWGECFFTLLDVGQGLSSVIQTQHHTLLYDAGPQYGQMSNAGTKIIKPFMRSHRIKSFDKVIISHGDLDHRAGLDAFEQGKLGDIITSEPSRLNKAARTCQAGESWEWDGVRFKMLGPNLVQNIKNRNNRSCVLKVETAHHTLLLTGDIEVGAEKALVASAQNLQSTIVVVPHHGSLTSSSQEFIQAVRPKYALFPVGVANRYGFPKQAVLKRYEEVGAINLLVSQTGALSFRLDHNAILAPPLGWREKTRRYWHYAVEN